MARLDRLTREWVLVLVTATLALSACVALDVTDRLDNFIYDLVMRHSYHDPDRRILLITIDDRSLNEMGAWPWPRSVEAALVERLGQARPRAILLDLLLTEPGNRDGDARLASAIAAAPVYLPVQFEVPGRNGAAFDTVKPLDALTRAAAGVGHVNLSFDADGTVRRTYRTYLAGARPWPQLAELVAGGHHATAVSRETANRPASISGDELRAIHPMLINYIGPQGFFPAISAASVLRGEVPPALLQGRLILVGATAAGLGDAYSTPSGADGTLTRGIEIQANILNSLLAGDFIVPITGLPLFALALAPLWLLLAALRVMRPVATLATITGLLVAVLSLSLALLTYGHFWIAPGGALLGIVEIYPIWTWRRLASVSSYMASELQVLDRESDPLERPRPDLRQVGFVERQMGLLRSAIDRERDLRRFLIDRIEQMPDAVIVANRGGKVVLHNAGALSLFRNFRGDGELAVADDLLGYLLRTASAGARPIRFCEVTGDAGIAWGCQAHAEDGQSFDVRFEPQRSENGDLLGFVIRIVDTTTITLMQRQREDVLQLLTHDMRAPQASIIAMLDHADPADWGPEMAQRIKTYASRTLKLADDFVQLSRAQLLQYKFTELNFVDIGYAAVDALSPQARLRKISLEIAIEEDEIMVRGEPSLLSRALMNLLDNAVKFSSDGAIVRLTMSRTIRERRESVVCSVSDSGVGIPREQMAALYNRFENVRSGPTGADGVGLGLAFVKTVVTRHGGTILCDSEEGVGTTFRVELPTIAAIAKSDELDPSYLG